MWATLESWSQVVQPPDMELMLACAIKLIVGYISILMLHMPKQLALEAPKGENFIPLAPDWAISGGIAFNPSDKFSGGIRYRFLDDRPANEDNSIVAKGYFIMDINANYKLGKHMEFGLAIQNMFNTEWNETQFATLSQLRNETQPVEEIHFTPGNPFFVQSKHSL